MFKLTIVILALAITYAAAQTDAPSPDSASSGSGGACADDASFKGTQPQNKDKTCAQQTPDNCKFIDESIKRCCALCQTRQNEKSAPTQAPGKGKGKGGKKKGCFHGADKVETKQYGTITMSELAAEKRDAHVLTRNDDGQLEYAPVRYWMHAQPEMSMRFEMFTTESGHKLSLTGEHLIYETDCRGNGGESAIFAKNVRVGRCLYVKNENGLVQESRIVEKTQAKLNGIYSPITSTGRIVVNDVLASCYNNYENESLQKLVYQYVFAVQDMVADWMPASLYKAAFNDQNGAFVGVPRLVFNFLQLSNVFVH